MDMTIKEFCETHEACRDGVAWALENCSTMQEVWDTSKPEWLVWVATRRGVLTDKELRLFAVWCCRQIWHLITDERSRDAVDVAEQYATGEATAAQLGVAEAGARAAMAARDAAARDARDAAWDAARAAARSAQSAYLREHCAPCFCPAGREEGE